MVDFAGYKMPIQYTGITAEHLNVRDNVGIFDVSHMGEFIIYGPESEQFLNYVCRKLMYLPIKAISVRIKYFFRNNNP